MCLEIYTLLVPKSKQRYPFWLVEYPMNTHFLLLRAGMKNNQWHTTLNNLVLCYITRYTNTFVLRLSSVTYWLNKLLFEERQPNIVCLVLIEQVKLFLHVSYMWQCFHSAIPFCWEVWGHVSLWKIPCLDRNSLNWLDKNSPQLSVCNCLMEQEK